jgi:hypothetical protein
LDVELEVNAYPAIKRIVLGRRGRTVRPAASVLEEVRDGQVALAEISAPSLSQTVSLSTSYPEDQDPRSGAEVERCCPRAIAKPDEKRHRRRFGHRM